MKLFDGTSDPVEHVARYKQQMLANSFRPDQQEACMCRVFGTTLTGPALTWFVKLPNGGINSFVELVNLFNLQFTSSRVLEKQTNDNSAAMLHPICLVICVRCIVHVARDIFLQQQLSRHAASHLRDGFSVWVPTTPACINRHAI
ncbi:unnamed protein product [Cuscuta europaea]|uniref:Retrotransposon gag domain-containing protein n=1 Tax=Cuscuta europaea TaxID=41803 RepID=A0A9P1A077_CUSEU|nr:unnamed protein product [Cuscuta europaea]